MGGFGSLPTGQRISLFYFCKEKKMEKPNPVYLESDMIEITRQDVEIARNAFSDFRDIAETHRNFYVTVFENRENRKLIFKFSGGICRVAKIEKIDEGEE
jgi:hypothetical protein